ncbi:MAG: homing endonuclease associated repeat-containing protein [Halobacterium sp.]
MATREDCLRALETAARRLGESPTKAQYEDLDITPSASTILRHCDGWNAAKEEAGLETNFSTGSRVEPKPDDVSIPPGHDWNSLSQDQRWHYRNREENAQRSRDRRRELRRWFYEYRAEQEGCTRCSTVDPACLELHHADDVEKTLTVNEMIASGYSKDAIRAEITQCEVLCANCHWREHNDEPEVLSSIDTTPLDDDPDPSLGDVLLDETPAPHRKEDWLRAWTYAYQRARGCRECGETDPVCLQFHHETGDKTMGVGAMITRSRSVEEVVAEVGKTIVLCANCHRVKHHQAPGSLSR